MRAQFRRICGHSRALPICALLCLTFLAADAAPQSPFGVSPDRIVIEKQKHTLTLLRGEAVLRTYRVALGTQPSGAKTRQGDHKTPEGLYSIDRKNPNSRFHRALHLSYPNARDAQNAARLGINPGGDVEIHGLGSSFGWMGKAHRLHDWTDGCVALTNEEMDEIYPVVKVGTPVEIRP